jgi:molybdopterin-guanine dinucleotide biosynthesis protein A
MPGLHPPLVRELCARAARGTADLVAPEGPRGIEPLHAVWSVAVADTLLRFHDEGLRRLQSLRDHLRVDVVPRSELAALGMPASRSLTNVNTTQELARFLDEESDA